MVDFIDNYDIILPDQRRYDTQIHLKAGREHERRISLHKARKLLLQFYMDVQSTVKKTGTRASRTVLLYRLYRGLFDFRVICEPQVIIRSHHDHFPAVHHDFGVLGAFYDPEKWINSHFLQCPGGCKLKTFF